MTKIVISACTYKRPDGLSELLSSLKEIKIPDDINLSIRIIDNEPEPAAEKLVKQVAETMPCPIHYAHEPDAGIAPARNCALSEAKDDDFLVFIDDDETADPNWLNELWTVQKNNHAQFVQGPVVLNVQNEKDKWWIDTLLFRLKTFPNNAPRHEAWSNNVMIDMNFVREHNLQFDPALRFDGGEDTLFFQQMTAKGAKGIFAANAIVYEEQPKERLNWKWSIARQFRNGNTRAMIAKRTSSGSSAILKSIMRAGGCAFFGLLHLPTTIILGRKGLANSVAYFARCAGILWGLLGKRYLEYERKDKT